MPTSLLPVSEPLVVPENSATARINALTSLATNRRAPECDAPSATRSLHLDVVRDEAGFHALAPYWDGLLARCATRTPFLTWDWVSLWWEEYRSEFQPAIGVLRDENHIPLAIAPLVLGRPHEGARRHLRHITFLGGLGEITSEGMDFLVPRGREDTFTPLLCETFIRLRGRWDSATLSMLREDSPNIPHLLRALGGFGSGASIVGRSPSHFITLPESWEAIEGAHSANWRSNHRRKWKKMTGHHAGRPLVGGKDLPAAEAFEALLALHSKRWCERESMFLRDHAKNFHRKLTARWVPQGRMSINVLELDGEPGAATYCFNHDGRAWFYQAGWKADYGDISIGKMAIAWAVQCAIQLGLRDFDFLPGNQPYKQEWSNRVHHVVDIEAFNPLSPRAAIFRALRYCRRKTTRAGSNNAHSSASDFGN